MQVKNSRRSNEDRTRETRAALLTAARALFVEKGYAETSTPEIVKTANVTRGALYHHFSDKLALFLAVFEAEAEAIAEEINAVTSRDMEPLDAMITGANAYFDAMSVEGRARIMLIDAPAVLGMDMMRAIDKESGGESLRQGLAFMAEQNDLSFDVASTADLMSAMFDRAALAIAIGEDAVPYRASMENLTRNLVS